MFHFGFMFWLIVAVFIGTFADSKYISEETNRTRNSFVGFTAWNRQTQAYVGEAIVDFKAVSVNKGNAYNPDTSSFICPRDGFAIVAVNFKTDDASELTLKTGSYPRTYSSGNSVNGNVLSCYALSKCYAGSDFSVRGNYDGRVYGEIMVPHSTFSVWLIPGLQEPFIGFSVSKQYVQSHGTGDTIIFERIHVDTGDHFRQNKFICPETGIYHITLTVKGGPIKIGVLHELDILFDLEDEYIYNTVTNSGVFRCVAGDNIRAIGTGDGEASGYRDRPFTSFTVMLMHREDSNESFVGFTSYKLQGQSYTEGDVITFNGILTNVGEQFNPSDSTFTCPYHGMYFVAVTFKKNDTNPLSLAVYHQDTVILVTQETFDGNPWNTVSNSGLVECFLGDKIHVKGTADGQVHGDPTKKFTTFTVMSLYQY